MDEGEAVEVVGERQALLGDDGQVAGVIEITRVETHSFGDVPWEFADAEGEGFRSIEHWREGHLSYYAERNTDVDDRTSVVCVCFVSSTRGPSQYPPPPLLVFLSRGAISSASQLSAAE